MSRALTSFSPSPFLPTHESSNNPSYTTIAALRTIAEELTRMSTKEKYMNHQVE